MKTSKLLLGTLLVAIFTVAPATAGVPLPFTGEADFDFVGPGILIIPDPGGSELDIDPPAPPGTISGNDIKDLRLAYDAVNDVLYVALNGYGIIGDVDGDGDQATVTWGGGFDFPSLSGNETACVYFDLDPDPLIPFNMATSWDVILGVGVDMSFLDIGIYRTDNTSDPGSNFDFNVISPPGSGLITGHDPLPGWETIEPNVPSSPDANDLEFCITNFSTLLFDAKGIVDQVPGHFRVGAFIGQNTDGAIGEDYIYYHQFPSTEVTINSDPDFVIGGGTVDLTVTEENDSAGAVIGQVLGPIGATPIGLPFYDVEVEVTADGSPLVTLSDPGPLNIGEVLTWNASTDLELDDVPVPGPTTFVARASGVDQVGFVHNFDVDPDEVNQVDVVIISTDVDIKANGSDGPITLPPGGGNVTLTITEQNDGSVDLLNPYIEVFEKDPADPLPGTLIGTFDENSAEFQGGDDGNGELDGIVSAPPNGETWQWQVIVPSVAVTTEFVVIGHGTDPVLGWDVTWCSDIGIPEVFCDQDEMDSVIVEPTPMPEIDVTKMVDCEETLPNYPVYYTICIQNIGTVPVLPTLVFDDKLGDLTGDFIAACNPPLPPDANCCLTFGPFFHDGSENPITNTVTFDATDLTGFPAPTVDANATVALVDPNFEVTKTCLTDPVPAGQPARFEIVITNTGDVDLIVLTDEPTLPGPLPIPAGGMPIIHEVDVPVPPDVTEVCNVINVMAFIDTPDNICIDGEPVEPPKDANDCCPVPPPGGEGCTPGFWKNNGDKHGASAWCERFSPSDPISWHFMLNETLVIRGKGKSTISNPTLLQALDANGGGVNAMIRHGIAAMLNACSDCVQYEYSSPDEVISMIEDALNGVPGAYTVDELHSMFAENNEAGCPVNQQGDCVGVEVDSIVIAE